MAKTKTLLKFVTQAGTATLAYLDKPDTSKLGKNKYKCGVLLEKGVEANDQLAAKLKELHKAAKGVASKAPVKDGDKLAEEDGEKYERLRGFWQIIAKSNEKPTVVGPKGAKGGPIAKAPRSGDLIKLALAAAEYHGEEGSGVTLFLNAVQLLERRASSGADAFGDESESYGDVEDTADTPFDDTPPESNGTQGPGDF